MIDDMDTFESYLVVGDHVGLRVNNLNLSPSTTFVQTSWCVNQKIKYSDHDIDLMRQLLILTLAT